MPEIPAWLAAVPLGEVLAWGGGAVAVVLAIWKGWPIFRKVVALLSASIKLVDTLATLPEDLATIKHELQHNGGGSVKDSVVRTENAVAELAAQVGVLDGKVVHVQKQAASLKTTTQRTDRQLKEHIAAAATEAV